MPDLEPDPQYAHRSKVLLAVVVLMIFGVGFLIKGALF